MERVLCCMCGDVGFSDKLFRCIHCRNRFQHSYCSNYYSEFAEPMEYCDWCRKLSSDTNKKAAASSSTNNSSASLQLDNHNAFITNRSEYSSRGGVKHTNRHEPLAKIAGGSGSGAGAGAGGGAGGGVPSPRTPTRRYKLLKDVMC